MVVVRSGVQSCVTNVVRDFIVCGKQWEKGLVLYAFCFLTRELTGSTHPPPRDPWAPRSVITTSPANFSHPTFSKRIPRPIAGRRREGNVCFSQCDRKTADFPLLLVASSCLFRASPVRRPVVFSSRSSSPPPFVDLPTSHPLHRQHSIFSTSVTREFHYHKNTTWTHHDILCSLWSLATRVQFLSILSYA